MIGMVIFIWLVILEKLFLGYHVDIMFVVVRAVDGHQIDAQLAIA